MKKEPTREEMIKALTLAQEGKLSKDELIEEVTDRPEETWISREGGPWHCSGRPESEDIPFDQADVLRKRKNVSLMSITYGMRNGNETVNYNGKTAIEVVSTGVPLANRETDVDMGDYTPNAEPVQRVASVKRSEAVNQPAPDPQQAANDYFGGLYNSGSDRLDRISNLRKDM